VGYRHTKVQFFLHLADRGVLDGLAEIDETARHRPVAAPRLEAAAHEGRISRPSSVCGIAHATGFGL
jgi:hypothetical protein